jgi:hypothetical protein
MSGSPDVPKKLYKQVDIKLIFKQLSYEWNTSARKKKKTSFWKN